MTAIEPIIECPVCGEKLLAALKGDDWFVCDNCGTTGEAEETETDIQLVKETK